MTSRKNILSVVFILFIGIFFTNTTYARTIKWLDGNWEGRKFQTNNQESWQMKFSCNSKQNAITVEYPELSCKGTFIVKQVKGKMVILIEKIKSGSCVNDGYIIITYATKDLITFTCLRDNKTRLASYCTLERK